MSKTRTFSGSQTAVNTNTILTAQGSVGTANNIVPGGQGGSNKIKRLTASAASDFLGLGNAVYFIRISGDGIKNGEQTIMIGAGGGQIVTTAQAEAFPLILGNGYPTDPFGDLEIECNNGGIVTVAAEMAETDIGSIGVAVTLEFEHD